MAGHPEDTKTWIEWIENGGVYDQTGETDVIVPMNSFWKKAPVGGELNSSISMRRMLVKNLNETAELMKTIRFVRDHFDMTVLLIEHDMKLVSGICERLTVLNFGHMLAEGPTSEVLSNPEVIKAYLGE